MLALTACIPSVNPFYTEHDLTFDPRLVGEWQVDNNEIWKFESKEDKSYKFTLVDKDKKTGKLNARLFTLKGTNYLDIIPSECDFAQQQADLIGAAVFPGHLLMCVKAWEPELKIAFCDYDWLKKHLEATPNALAHRNEDDSMLITASTHELQKFMEAHGQELFETPKTLTRAAHPTGQPVESPAR